MSDILIGHSENIELIESKAKLLEKGNGSVVAISGETGFGKTHFLQYIREKYSKKNSNKVVAYSESQAPIGNFNVGNIQPLYPFAKIVERLLDNKHISPERRFALNVGMTALASIPFLGDVFYAVKEMGRDWRQFKKEKSSANAGKVSSAAADYFDTFAAYAHKTPLVMLIDDMHWADAQSVELLTIIREKITEIPLMLVFTYKQSVLESQGVPLMSFVNNQESITGNFLNIELQAFGRKEIEDYSKKLFDNYKSNSEFESWIIGQSYGVPGVAAEYLRYFSKFPPFGPDGELATNIEGNEFLPTSIQALFAEQLDSLTEEERNMLAICSAEGREFSAAVVSKLMNDDVLTTIKKLRSLQNKTGIIKSIGAQSRYGIKTTMYKFNQVYFHTFFENSLEYEEYTALHGEIAAYLKQRYEETDSDDIREEIAPYLAAHSAESGDEETAKDMLLFSASTAEKYGSTEIIEQAYRNFERYSGKVAGDETSPRNEEFHEKMKELSERFDDTKSIAEIPEGDIVTLDSGVLDFNMVRKTIVNDYNNGRYSEAIEKVNKYTENISEDFSKAEIAQLLALAAKCRIQSGEYDSAEDYVRSAMNVLENDKSSFAECFVFNVAAVLYSELDDFSRAYHYMDKAANIAVNLPDELKLLTVANLSLILKKITPEKSEKYFDAAVKMSEALNYKQFKRDLSKNYK
jgi:hypothetical protein